MSLVLRPALRLATLPPAALLTALLALFLLILPGSPARAQDQVWLQIEAQPTEAEARERAEAYAGAFANVRGFQLKSGWYAIVLGPYATAEGAGALVALKSENLVPPDSFVVDGTSFAAPFWPAGGAPAAAPAPPAAPEAAPPAAAEPAPPAEEPEETQREAFASEAALSAEDKRLLQTALKWFGFYQGGIDGAYGPGTRGAMAAWQEALGLDPTGVLTARQRATLVANYQAELAEYGFAAIEEQASGINVTLPLSLVEFDRYDPPFVHYKAKDGSGFSIVLISQPGDQGAFDGLYDLLQTLDAIPATGEREKGKSRFTIHGTSDTHDTRVEVGLKDGFIKGWMVLSAPGNADRDARILEVLGQTFRPVGETALDPGMVPLDDAARRGLVAGLTVKKPRLSRSGFYVSDRGDVLTTVEAVESCGKITLDRHWKAKVTLADAASGLAVLAPETALAPAEVAAFGTASPRIGTEIAVAGYSYEDRLPSAVLTFGALEELAGLNGEAGLTRLSLAPLAGDAGGPVMDGSGTVLGMLLPAAPDGARQLPAGVAFAASAPVVVDVLGKAGIRARTTPDTPALAPETLTRHATGMTVLVSCWE